MNTPTVLTQYIPRTSPDYHDKTEWEKWWDEWGPSFNDPISAKSLARMAWHHGRTEGIKAGIEQMRLLQQTVN